MVSLKKQQRSFDEMLILVRKLLVAILQRISLHLNVLCLVWRVHKKDIVRFTLLLLIPHLVQSESHLL